MEGVTVEYGKGFTAGTERRESGSMGRLAEHTAGLGGRRSRWDGVGPVELLAFCTWATLFLVTWRFSLPVTSLVGLLILLEKTHVILFLYFCLYLVRSISCFPNQLRNEPAWGKFSLSFRQRRLYSGPGDYSAHINDWGEVHIHFLRVVKGFPPAWAGMKQCRDPLCS